MDITLYHKQYNNVTRLDEWQRTQYMGVHFHAKQAVTVDKGGLNAANVYTLRIMTNDTVTVSAGDYIVQSLVNFVNPQDADEKILITAVSDNRRGSPAVHHYKIEGK